MKRTLLLISVISVFAALCSAQDDAAYTAAMKTVNPSVGAIRAAITAKDNAKVAEEANKLAGTFDTVILAYWTSKKADDAIGFAKAARDDAKAIAAATDSDAQTAALRTLQGVCGQCHTAHRAGGGGQFTIK
jgi:mono/diheme cytochrome c family protein